MPQARANIEELHFLPFNPVDKRTAITYIDADGKWYRASKGAPEQVSKFSKKYNPTRDMIVLVDNTYYVANTNTCDFLNVINIFIEPTYNIIRF